MKTFNEILQDIKATHEAIKKSEANEKRLEAEWTSVLDMEERHEKRKALEAEWSAAGQETKDLYLSLYLLKNNARIALFNDVNEKGYRTSRGAEFNKNSLRTMLQNEKYIGVYRYKDIIVENGVPPIIDKQLFDRVQARFKSNYAARARKKAVADYLLTGKIFCGHCGANMAGESGTARNGDTYYYYKCTSRKRRTKTCDKSTEHKDWIEEYAVLMTLAQLTDERIEAIATTVSELLIKEAEKSSLLPTLKDMLRDIEKRIKNIIDLMEQGIATPSTKERLLELESQKADLITRITTEDMKKPLLSKERIMFWLCSFRNGDTNNPEYRRRVIDTLLNSIYVYDKMPL